MKRVFMILAKAVFYTALVFIGFNAGMCVKVFMERGVPVIHGGGELMLLLAIPVSIAIGYRLGKVKR